MGGSSQPMPMAGKAMNEEFFTRFAQQRQQKNLMHDALLVNKSFKIA